MKVLVVGNGGREHALAWGLLRSPQVTEVICAPGNGGTATLARCRNEPIGVSDFDGIANLVKTAAIDLVVVGPEVPLAEGITDFLRTQSVAVFGPSQAGAQIEASKAWAKQLMEEAGIPTATAAVFEEKEGAIAHLQTHGAPIVVKADGLAAGKGVTVAMTVEEAQAAIESAFGGQFGDAGNRVVLEEFLQGQEASVLAITDGKTIRPLLPAQDHKQIGEGDTGPNTGGMGVYAPTPVVDDALLERIQREVLEPAIAQLQKRGIDYRGILYAGLMITPNGDPKVIEFNCRFGDPETQVVLPLLETPLHELFLACVEQRLAEFPPLQWNPGAAACVVIAAKGYPGSYPKGDPITGIAEAEATGAVVFHAGTRLDGETVLTDGGRVLGVTATGESFEKAIAQAYAALEPIHFDGAYYRRDIGHRILK
ncbi:MULTISPECIES: phosphoribosylamine--glycine ligase [unclassified Leptolyngbya]|uniref:phosphoribosylamine--glycine ligase n=1 Tax=unclassified Leptolyngbya TaxID=2650499 RepID=UPI001687BE45|nr:phosphoribosylamine--glycine ligase [Leptolyngbya sp. FACHB-8]MBD2154691.1 phosphoribosylamine--glycine ligase [Leptolyngbya sp. FACHB-16]